MLSKAELDTVGHPVGPGRRGRRPRRRTRTPTDLHLADTLKAGAGLCDVDAVRVLVDEGPARVNELIALGAVFDTDDGGRLLLAREGGHSMARVVHAGGAATGARDRAGPGRRPSAAPRPPCWKAGSPST